MKQHSYMNLGDSGNHAKFVEYLEACEPHVDGFFTEWESRFITNMRELFDGREEAVDLGLTAWNPTVNQWNTLHTLWSQL